MRVLLINSPIRLDAKPSCIPYGLATLAATLRNHGFDVAIYDINATRPEADVVLADLASMAWDIVGVSGLITTYSYQKWLIAELKRVRPNGFVVSGGGLATSCPGLLFKNTPVDAIVSGEGEQTMLELCHSLSGDRGMARVAGLQFRKNGQVVVNKPRRNIEDVDTIPYPAWDLLPTEVYLKNPIWGEVAGNSSGFRVDVPVTRSMNVISSRGCPFSCRYCYHLFGRSDYRFRSPENVVGEIERLVDKHGVDFIGFVDDNMMASKRRLLAFCDLMEKKGLPVTWGCHGRVTSAEPEVLGKMARAGCVWIGYGVESGSQTILDAMNKKATVGRAKDAIANTRKVGIFANTTFIFGYPGETLETIQETVDFKREMGLECGSFFATPYPGAPLYEQIKTMIKDEEAFIRSLGNATEFTINLTTFPDEALLRLKAAMDNNEDVL